MLPISATAGHDSEVRQSDIPNRASPRVSEARLRVQELESVAARHAADQAARRAQEICEAQGARVSFEGVGTAFVIRRRSTRGGAPRRGARSCSAPLSKLATRDSTSRACTSTSGRTIVCMYAGVWYVYKKVSRGKLRFSAAFQRRNESMCSYCERRLMKHGMNDKML